MVAWALLWFLFLCFHVAAVAAVAAVVVLIVVTEDTLEHGDGFSRFAVGNVGWTPGRVMCRLFDLLVAWEVFWLASVDEGVQSRRRGLA